MKRSYVIVLAVLAAACGETLPTEITTEPDESYGSKYGGWSVTVYDLRRCRSGFVPGRH